jgi:hypothetical protein
LGWVSRARHIALREAHTPHLSSSSTSFFTYKKTNTDGKSKKINDGINNNKNKKSNAKKSQPDSLTNI